MFSFLVPQSKIDFMSHISPEIQALHDSGATITLIQYMDMRLNSYEAKYIEPQLDDQTFIFKLGNCIKNVRDIGQYSITSVYEDYLATDGAKESFRRLMALDTKVRMIKTRIILHFYKHETTSPLRAIKDILGV